MGSSPNSLIPFCGALFYRMSDAIASRFAYADLQMTQAPPRRSDKADAYSAAQLCFASFPRSIRCATIRSTLDRDTMAGLTVAAVAVPQAMAYAQIAGMPPQYGLYTAIVMTAVGALLDSSKQLINGPTNAISIAVLSALVGFSDAERIPAAILLALWSASFRPASRCCGWAISRATFRTP